MTQQTDNASSGSHAFSAESSSSAGKSDHGGRALVGPFTARDVVVFASVLMIFVSSLLPLTIFAGQYLNAWTGFGVYFIFIGVLLPLIVGVLFAIRRLSPDTKPRIGSLSVDQFASVVASFAFAYFFFATAANFQISYLVGALGAAALLCATVLAMVIPLFAADFAGRAEVPAHAAARNSARPMARPAAPKPALALPAGSSAPAMTFNPGAGAGGVPAQGGAQGWNGARQQNHASGGQIFTPAGTTQAGAAATFPTSNAASSFSNPPFDAGEAHRESTLQAGPTDGADPVIGSSLPDSNVQAPTRESQNSDATQAPEASQKSEAVSGVVLPESDNDAPETRMNPQLNEPAGQSIGATVNQQAPTAVNANPFWFAVDRQQNVIDERTGQFLYKLAPGSWILALEDRGTSFLVQDGHGKTGVLLDLIGIERAPENE